MPVVYKFDPSTTSLGHLVQDQSRLAPSETENGPEFLVLPRPPCTSDAGSSLGTAVVLRFSRTNTLETLSSEQLCKEIGHL